MIPPKNALHGAVSCPLTRLAPAGQEQTIGDVGLEQRKRRWRDFLSRDKPAQHVFMVGVDDGKPPARPWPRWDNVPQRIERAWGMYRRQWERMELYPDDTVPFLHVYTGTEIYAEAFGCSVASPENNMPFARHIVDNASDATKIKTPELFLPELQDLSRRYGGLGMHYCATAKQYRRTGRAARLRLAFRFT